MKKQKMHYQITVNSPSEDDPQGYCVSMCGREQFERGTHDKDLVTCKTCLVILDEEKQQRIQDNGQFGVGA